jgi:FixJ family two-component response regulator
MAVRSNACVSGERCRPASILALEIATPSGSVVRSANAAFNTRKWSSLLLDPLEAAWKNPGLDLQKRMAEAGMDMPIIFITGHGDIPMTVRALKAGAVEFLTKPFRDQDLLDAIQEALERDRAVRRQRAETDELRCRLELLTRREREVMALVVTGLLNKQIAGQVGASEATVKVHRHQVMEKMGAGSLAELVRMADRLGVSAPKS